AGGPRGAGPGDAAGLRPPGRAARQNSGGQAGLARTAAGPLGGHDRTAKEQLAAPYSPGLGALDGLGQALGPHRALGAQFLRAGHVYGRLGEEQVGSSSELRNRVLASRSGDARRARKIPGPAHWSVLWAAPVTP